MHPQGKQSRNSVFMQQQTAPGLRDRATNASSEVVVASGAPSLAAGLLQPRDNRHQLGSESGEETAEP